MRMGVRLLIAALCAAALVVILAIVGDSELDEASWKAIGTAIALAFFSLTAIAGTNLAARRPELSLFGYLTAILSIVAFVTMTSTIWGNVLDSDWKGAGIATVLALASGHVSLLLGSARSEDSDTVRLVRGGVILAAAVLCLMAVVEISSRGEDVGIRTIAVVAVLYVLGTILLPLLRRASVAKPSEG